MRNYMKEIRAHIATINSITYDEVYDEEADRCFYIPCFINGDYAPDAAGLTLCFAQSGLFNILQDMGLPLHGFVQLDTFIRKMNSRASFREAYNAARKEQAQFRCKLASGTESADDPVVEAEEE